MKTYNKRKPLAFSAMVMCTFFIMLVGFKSFNNAKLFPSNRYAKITNVTAVSNVAQVVVDGKAYGILYGDHLDVFCDEQSSGGLSKTVFLLDIRLGTFSRKRYVFAGYRYSIWIDQNGNWEISQQA